jgi:hypothetical protein
LLSDDADSAKQYSNANNSANLDISAKSLIDVSLGTQRKGWIKKNETNKISRYYTFKPRGYNDAMIETAT